MDSYLSVFDLGHGDSDPDPRFPRALGPLRSLRWRGYYGGLAPRLMVLQVAT